MLCKVFMQLQQIRAGKCQDKFAVLTKNIKVRRGEPEEEYHTEKVL